MQNTNTATREIPAFLAIHDGEYTVENIAKGTSRTLRVRTQKENAKFAPNGRIVSVLTGPDNSEFGSWTGVGTLEEVLDEDGPLGILRGWAPKAGRSESLVAAGDFLIQALQGENRLTRKVNILRSTCCACCHKKLTDADSIRRGIGPICWGKMGF